MDYDFIVGFTLFTPKGFRTMYRHFDKIDTAKMFASNVNIKDNNKIYIDLKYMQDKIKAKIEELEIEQESNREDLKIAIDNLSFQNIDKIVDKISINMSVREILQSLLKE